MNKKIFFVAILCCTLFGVVGANPIPIGEPYIMMMTEDIDVVIVDRFCEAKSDSALPNQQIYDVANVNGTYAFDLTYVNDSYWNYTSNPPPWNYTVLFPVPYGASNISVIYTNQSMNESIEWNFMDIIYNTTIYDLFEGYPDELAFLPMIGWNLTLDAEDFNVSVGYDTSLPDYTSYKVKIANEASSNITDIHLKMVGTMGDISADKLAVGENTEFYRFLLRNPGEEEPIPISYGDYVGSYTQEGDEKEIFISNPAINITIKIDDEAYSIEEKKQMIDPEMVFLYALGTGRYAEGWMPPIINGSIGGKPFVDVYITVNTSYSILDYTPDEDSEYNPTINITKMENCTLLNWTAYDITPKNDFIMLLR